MANKSSPSDSPAVPSAFGIRLGFVSGRTSPDPVAPTVVVNAETTVNWIFMQAAYVHNHIHGRDNTALQADFDLVLVRPGKEDIILSPARVIADYKIGRNDLLQLRHKTLPIPVCINLFVGGEHKIEVNSGFPLIDVVPNICHKIGIRNYDELSLALPTTGPGESTMQYEWLDIYSSLRGQGVQDGDTVLLRKKFFILNDDITEALDGNEILEVLIYEQIKQMYTTENFVGYEQQNMAACAKLSCLLHCMERLDDESINDEESVRRVTPKLLQKNSDFFRMTVLTYYRDCMETLEGIEARKQFLRFFSSPQSVLVNFFPVKVFDDGLQPQEHVLIVDSKNINIYQLIEDEQEKFKCVDGMSWRLKDLRDVECTSEKDQYLRINILGSWFEFIVDHRMQISCYLMEARILTKQSVSRQRINSINSACSEHPSLSDREDLTSSPMTETGDLGDRDRALSISSSEEISMDVTYTPKPTVVTIKVIEESISATNSDEEENDEEEKQESLTPQASCNALISGSEAVNEKVEEEMEVVPTETDEEAKENDMVELDMQSTEEQESSTSTTQDWSFLPLLPSLSSPYSATATSAITNGDSNSIPAEAPADIIDVISSIEKEASPSTSAGARSLSKSAEARSMSKSAEALSSSRSMSKSAEALSSTSSYVHIPEFLGLDFREVLEDYRLFQIVVMKKDVRSILLNVKKPVEEVISTVCQTFDIPDSGNHYLWIPTGIQNIIKKYRGRPKSRIGKFIKRDSRSSFAPRLDSSKSLQDQYNFNIKPYLLHLRHYQIEDNDIDGPYDGIIYAGQEWPDHCNPDVARYRKFYQSWTGIVQGLYPIERRGAVKMAALLTQVYYGAREDSSTWPPYDYDAKIFLPETHKHSYGIINEVEKVHLEQSEQLTAEDCINDLIQGCEKLATMSGVFFEVAEPVKSDILKVIPWNKMERRWFGISTNGIFGIDKETEEINFCYDLSEISKWSYTESSFKLILFHGMEFDAYTYQAKEILDTLDLFIQIKLGRERLIAPEKPLTRIIAVPTKCGGPIDGRSMLPLNLRVDSRQSIISPTTYDL